MWIRNFGRFFSLNCFGNNSQYDVEKKTRNEKVLCNVENTKANFTRYVLTKAKWNEMK